MRAYSTVGFAAVYNPMVIATDRRTWTDSNGDDVAQNSEIGPVVTPFNITGVSNRTPDPNIKRPYQWEYNAGVQRELMPGVSVSAGWVRREFKRLFWTDNILVDPATDYTVVNIANPPSGIRWKLPPLHSPLRGRRGLRGLALRESGRGPAAIARPRGSACYAFVRTG